MSTKKVTNIKDLFNPPAPEPDPPAPTPPTPPAAPPAPEPPPPTPPAPDDEPEPPAGDPPPADPPTDPAPPEPDELTTEQIAAEFWGTVTTELGFESAEMEEILGNLTPEERVQPAAIVAYTKAIAERVQASYDAELRKADPRAYAYRLHRMKGGTDDEFLNPGTRSIPDEETLKGSLDLQRQFYKSSLIRKGIGDKQAELLVNEAVKSGELEGLSLAERETQTASEQQRLQKLQRDIDDNNQRVAQAYNNVVTDMTNSVVKGEGLSIHIPEASRTPFLDFVKEKIVMDEEQGLCVTVPIKQGTAEFNNLIQGLYLMFNKGDVTKLVGKAAPAGKPRLGLPAKAPVPPAQTPPAPPPTPGRVTIGQLWNKTN